MALGETTRLMITLPVEDLAKLARLSDQRKTSIAAMIREFVYSLPNPEVRKVAGSPPPQAKTEESSLTSMAHERTLDYSEGQ